MALTDPHRLRIVAVQHSLEATCTCGRWSTYQRMTARERAWSYAQRKRHLRDAHARHLALVEPGTRSVGSQHDRPPRPPRTGP